MNRAARAIFAVAMASALAERPAKACTQCMLGASALVGTYGATAGTCPATTGPASPGPEPEFHLSIGTGVDVTTAYFHRGYVMDEQSAITQPYFNIGGAFNLGEGINLTPYAGVWNDFQSGGTRNSGNNNGTAVSGAAVAPMPCCADGLLGSSAAEPSSKPTAAAALRHTNSSDGGYGLYETDITTGITLRHGPLFADLRLREYTYPGGALSDYQEVGVKFSYDIASLWARAGQPHHYLIRPYVEYDHQTLGAASTRYNYVETGIEPSFVVYAGRVAVGVSLPFEVGLSASNYYTRATGENQVLGFFGQGIKATIPLTASSRWGTVYLSLSAQYLHLNADSLRTLNNGSRDEVTGTLGLSYSF